MSVQRSDQVQALHIESVKIHRDLLLTLRVRNEIWLKDPDNIESRRIRREILESLGKTIAQYDDLLERLESQFEKSKEELDWQFIFDLKQDQSNA